MDLSNILIRSVDRGNQSDPSHLCSVPLKDPIKGRYRIKNINFLNLVYNVTSANNTFSYSQSATTKTCSIQNGFYDSISIVSVLQTALNASTPSASGTFTVSSSSITGFITITNNTTAFTILGSTSTNLSRTLGFGIADSASSLTVTSTYPINIPRCVIMNVSDQKPLYNSATRSLLGIYIPLGGSFGSIFNFQPNTSFQEYVDFKESTQLLNLSITDTNGALLSLNNAEYDILLEKCKE